MKKKKTDYNIFSLFDERKEGLNNLPKSRNQSLRQPEAKHKLGTGHQQLGYKALEKRAGTFVLDHIRDDSGTALRVLEVSVLDTSFDDVQGSGDDEGCAGAEDGGDEVLAPGCGVVVLEGEDVFFREGGATEELSIISIGDL